MSEEKFLKVEDLNVHYITTEQDVFAVNGVSFELEKGKTLGLVGETGAGKTTIARAILGILPNPPAKVLGGKIYFEGKNIFDLSEKEMQAIRGDKITMIFQDPMTALNPVITVGEQIAEVVELHNGGDKAAAKARAIEMLETVGIPAERYVEYPHQFSGGMKQRVVIAIALACRPELLIADEPTTALDVTIQMQVLDLMNNLKKQLGTSMVLITHDFGVVAEMCEKVAIMYAGEVVEYGTARDIFNHGCHPYTRGLFESLPSLNEDQPRLKPIVGLMPDPTQLPVGCNFAPRCPYCTDACKERKSDMVNLTETHQVKCDYAVRKFREETDNG